MALKFCQWTYEEFAIRWYCHTQNLGCMTLVLLFSSLSSSMNCVNFLSCFQVPWSTYIQPYFDTKYNEILQSTFKWLSFPFIPALFSWKIAKHPRFERITVYKMSLLPLIAGVNLVNLELQDGLLNVGWVFHLLTFYYWTVFSCWKYVFIIWWYH